MTYKEALFFIGKCLTISHEEKNLEIVSKAIKTDTIDWDSVVKVSTSHYVFPTLYCNLKRADLLSYLPEDLVSFMKHITDLNRERNLQIIEQAEEVHNLLTENGITPIFLKGTGNLLEGLYKDVAERMVGDIDFLVSKDQFEETITLLKNSSYSEGSEINRTFINRHYSPLIHQNKIAAVEVHYRMVVGSLENIFNYQKVTSKKSGENTLSIQDGIIMTCINKQVNDRGYWYKNISLRNSYDLFLLSQEESILKTLKEFKHGFNFFNSFLASSNIVFNNPVSLIYEKNEQVKKDLETLLKFLDFQKKNKKNRQKWDFIFLWKDRFRIFLMFFYKKEVRNYLFKKTFH